MLKELRKKRIQLKLTQGELAARANVSLATLQNVEAGRANPSYETLKSLLGVLGCELDIRSSSIDWTALSTVGVPLFDLANPSAIRPHRDYLQKQLEKLASQLLGNQMKGRESLALYSFLCALRDHFPSVWQNCPKSVVRWATKQRSLPSAKLRRLALQKLAEYL